MTARALERIAVTGLGMVTSLGEGSKRVFHRLVAGDVGIDSEPLELGVTLPKLPVARVVLADVGATPEPKAQTSWSRCDVFAVKAAREALAQAGLFSQSVEALVGETAGTLREAVLDYARGPSDDTAPLLRRMVLEPLGMTSVRLREALEQVTSSVVVCSACSSGALAIALGAMRLEQGAKQPQLVGGTDSLNALTLTGFGALGALSSDACRPFDEQRQGLNLGEGAAFLVLETETMVRARGGTVLAWLDGYAVGAEAHHLTHPEADGKRASELIAEAMSRAGLTARDIGYVNAHGTATVQNDAMETTAMCRVFRDETARIRVSSSKGQLGHTLGAAGAIEAAIVVEALCEQVVPPTAGLVTPSPECALSLVARKGVTCEFTAALSSSFGFGGAGAVLALVTAEGTLRRSPLVERRERVFVTSVVTLGPSGILRGRENARLLDESTQPLSPRLPFEPLDALVMERSRRFDRLTALSALGTELTLAGAARSGQNVGLVLGNALGDVSRSVEFLRRVRARGLRAAQPAEFPHLLPSSVSGNASIYAGLTGPVFNVSQLGPTATESLLLARTCLRSAMATAMIMGTVEVVDDAVFSVLLEAGKAASTEVPPTEGAAFLLLESGPEFDETTGREPRCELLASANVRDFIHLAEPSWRPSGSSEVLSSIENEGAELDEVLRAVGWQDVPRRSAQARVGTGWHYPGFMLATAAARVLAGEVERALVLTETPDGVHLTLLALT